MKAFVSAILATIVAAEVLKPKEDKATITVVDGATTKATYDTVLSWDGNKLIAEFTLTATDAFNEATNGNSMISGVCGPWSDGTSNSYCLTAETTASASNAAARTVKSYVSTTAATIDFSTATPVVTTNLTPKCTVAAVAEDASNGCKVTVSEALSTDAAANKGAKAKVEVTATEASMKAWTADWTKVKAGGYFALATGSVKLATAIKAAGLTNPPAATTTTTTTTTPAPAGAYAATAALSVAAAVFAVTAF